MQDQKRGLSKKYSDYIIAKEKEERKPVPSEWKDDIRYSIIKLYTDATEEEKKSEKRLKMWHVECDKGHGRGLTTDRCDSCNRPTCMMRHEDM